MENKNTIERLFLAILCTIIVILMFLPYLRIGTSDMYVEGSLVLKGPKAISAAGEMIEGLKDNDSMEALTDFLGSAKTITTVLVVFAYISLALAIASAVIMYIPKNMEKGMKPFRRRFLIVMIFMIVTFMIHIGSVLSPQLLTPRVSDPDSEKYIGNREANQLISILSEKIASSISFEDAADMVSDSIKNFSVNDFINKGPYVINLYLSPPLIINCILTFAGTVYVIIVFVLLKKQGNEYDGSYSGAGESYDGFGASDYSGQPQGFSENARCEFGHFYNASLYDSCPFCEGSGGPRDASATVPMTQPEVTEKAKSLTDAVEDAAGANLAQDGERTVAFYEKQIGKEPVVGWLVCCEGPHKGQDFRLKSGKNFIGRSKVMDVSIAEDKTVSRERHAAVTFDPKHVLYIVQPGDSKELFYINDEVVLNPVPIKKHDVLTLGNTKLVFFPCCDSKLNWSERIKKTEE